MRVVSHGRTGTGAAMVRNGISKSETETEIEGEREGGRGRGRDREKA